MKGRAKVRQRLGQAQIFIAVGFDGAGNFLQSFESACFRRFHLGGIPFHLQRGKIQEKQAQREQLPFPALAHQTHGDLVNACAGGVGSVAELHGEKRNIVAKFGAADLHLRGDVGSLAANNGAAGGIRRGRGFARLIQEHEALHQRHACRRSHAGKRVPVASREKTNKLCLSLGTSRGEHGFQRGAGSAGIYRFARRGRVASAGLGTGFL